MSIGPASTVEIGIDYQTGYQEAESAVAGTTTKAQPAAPALFKPLIDYINAHGGLAGHHVKPIYTSESALSSDAPGQDQAACTALTQDHHPVAVIIQAGHLNGLYDCLEKAGVPYVDTDSYYLDDGELASHPHLVGVDSLSVTRMARAMVDGLYGQRYFSPGAKIGVVNSSDPYFTRAYNQGLIPALKAHHLSVTDVATMDDVGSADQGGRASSQAANAILRFRNEGIDHVIMMVPAAEFFFWIEQANTQHYTPRYGLNSNDVPIDATNGQYPRAQFVNSLVLGWLPQLDINHAPANAAAKHCDKIEAAAGNPTGSYAGWETCDDMFAVADAVNTAGSLSANAIIAALARIRNLGAAALLGRPDFANGRRDEVTTAAMLAWATSCNCFQYVTQASPLA